MQMIESSPVKLRCQLRRELSGRELPSALPDARGNEWGAMAEGAVCFSASAPPDGGEQTGGSRPRQSGWSSHSLGEAFRALG